MVQDRRSSDEIMAVQMVNKTVYIVLLLEANWDCNQAEVYGGFLDVFLAEECCRRLTAQYKAETEPKARDQRYWEVQGWAGEKQTV